MWANNAEYIYQDGALFLGQDAGRELGIKTERHAITIAGAGAGKGACVIIPNLKRWSASTLVIDPKGEGAEATAKDRAAMGQAVHVVDPFNSANVNDNFKSSYNPLSELNVDSMTIKEDIESISDGIVMRGDASASHWDDGAQAVISGLIAYTLLALPKQDQHLISVREILRNVDLFQEVATEMKSLDGCNGLCESGAAAIFAKEGDYFVSNAEKNTRWLDSEGMKNALTKSDFSLSDLKTKNTSIYLVLPANYLGQHGRFLRLFVRCAIEQMAHKTPDGNLRGNQCLFILDEFFSLGYIDEISKAAGLMRGYGLQLWPILQDLGQLLTLYGREGSETFFANADVHQFFGNTDNTTLEYISSRVGVKELSSMPMPPAPMTSNPSGLAQGIAGMMGTSQKGSMRAMGALTGAVSSAAANATQANLQAVYQDQMNNYQRAMSEHGKPIFSPSEIARIIQRKDDVVSNNIISFAFGSDALIYQPAPYFREEERKQLVEAEQARAAQAAHDAIPVYGNFAALFISMSLMALGAGIACALGYFFMDYPQYKNLAALGATVIGILLLLDEMLDIMPEFSEPTFFIEKGTDGFLMALYPTIISSFYLAKLAFDGGMSPITDYGRFADMALLTSPIWVVSGLYIIFRKEPN